jgi:hypothetical protein
MGHVRRSVVISDLFNPASFVRGPHGGQHRAIAIRAIPAERPALRERARVKGAYFFFRRGT